MLVTSDYCRVLPEHVEGWSRENVGWTAERCQRGPGLASKMTAPALAYKQSPGPRIWGYWRQSIERGRQGGFGHKQIHLGRKIRDFNCEAQARVRQGLAGDGH